MAKKLALKQVRGAGGKNSFADQHIIDETEFVDGRCVCHKCVDATAARLHAELAEEQARNVQLKLERARLEAKATVVHMYGGRTDLSGFDATVADSIQGNSDAFAALAAVESLLEQSGQDRLDTTARRAALESVLRVRKDWAAKLDATMRDAIVNNPSVNAGVNDPALRIQPTNTGGSGGGQAYRTKGFQRPAHEYGSVLASDVEHDLLVKLSEVCPTAELSTATVTTLADALGDGACVKKFMEVCKTYHLNPARRGENERALALTFDAVGAGHVAHATSIEEGLQIIRRRDKLEFPRDRPKAAAVLFRENRALCESQYKRSQAEVVQCAEADASANAFQAAFTEALVDIGGDPGNRAHRARAIELTLKRNPNLVPPMYRNR